MKYLFTAVSLLLVAAACNPTPPEITATAQDRSASVAAFNTTYSTAMAATQTWTGSDTPGCTYSAVDAAFEAQSINLVNYYRNMTGLPSITEDPALSALAQQNAHLNWANQSISHYPPASWDCFTTQAYDTAAVSNLSIGSACSSVAGLITPGRANGPRGVRGQQRDNGASNAAVGHRAWILNPTAGTMGSGSAIGFQNAAWCPNPYTQSTNTLHVRGASVARPSQEFVAWPPPGWVPDEVVYPRWSFSPNARGDKVDLSGAAVTATYGGSGITIPVVTVVDPDGVGGGWSFPDNRIVFEPELSEIDNTSWALDSNMNRIWADLDDDHDRTVRVDVTGVVVDGVSKDYTYFVTIMDTASANFS